MTLFLSILPSLSISFYRSRCRYRFCSRFCSRFRSRFRSLNIRVSLGLFAKFVDVKNQSKQKNGIFNENLLIQSTFSIKNEKAKN